MTRSFLIILLLLFVIPVYSASTDKGYVEGEILVKYKKDIKDSSYVLSGEKLLLSSDEEELRVVKIDDNETVDNAVDRYSQDENVEFAQPNYIYHISATPNDTYYAANNLWALKNTGTSITSATYPTNNPGTIGDDINIEPAWDYQTDCRSVVVAIVDTGVYYTHEDLSANMWDGGTSYPHHGYNYQGQGNNQGPNNDPLDNNGHGTNVAGIIGAVGNNAKGVTGVCWNANIMAVKAFDASGTSSTSLVIQGIDFAIANGANIINMSFNFNDLPDTLLGDEITKAQTNGLLVVAAAGNSAFNIDAWSVPGTYPCGYSNDNVICVCAVDQSFQIANFSNYGTVSVDICAPGTNIWSTDVDPSSPNNTSYAIGDGTSFSTPYVVGLAALLMSYNPNYTYSDVKLAIMNSGKVVPALATESVSGAVVDGFAALTYIIPPSGVTATVAQ